MTVLSSPFIWMHCFCYMSVFCAKTSSVDWGQLYLMEDRQHSQYVGKDFDWPSFTTTNVLKCFFCLSLQSGSAFTSSVESGGFFGGILAGYFADAAFKRRQKQLQRDPTPQPFNPRLPVALIFMIGVAISLHLLYFTVTPNSSQLQITLIGFLLGASLYGPIAIFGVVATEAAPVALSGTAHAIVALAANSKTFIAHDVVS